MLYPPSVPHPPSSLHQKWQILLEKLFMQVIFMVYNMYDAFLGERTKVSVFQNLGRTTLSLKDHPLILITTLS